MQQGRCLIYGFLARQIEQVVKREMGMKQMLLIYVHNFTVFQNHFSRRFRLPPNFSM